MPASPPEALADPLGVIVALVADADPSLARRAVEELANAVAPRRVTRRRLARAVLERPSLLVDGRSPAPRVVGDLLVGLWRAGASTISLPRCAGCAKELRSFHRRGEHWYCAACGPRRVACAVCGNRRRVAAIDRAGRAPLPVLPAR